MAYRNPHAFSLFISLFLLLSIPLICVAAHKHPLDGADLHRKYNDLSAKGILDKSIEALGGQSALDNVKTVSSHALCVRR